LTALQKANIIRVMDTLKNTVVKQTSIQFNSNPDYQIDGETRVAVWKVVIAAFESRMGVQVTTALQALLTDPIKDHNQGVSK
jgi:hypothetical protein